MHKVVLGDGVHGRGVFASVDIAQGDAVEKCPCIEITLGPDATPLSDYVFKSPNAGKALVVFGYGSLYNHAERPNIRVTEITPEWVVFTAGRDLKKGEELFIHYGSDGWGDRDNTPLS